jgi:hypothetical protein
MFAEPLLECSFLIPIRRDEKLSDGEPHDPELWEWLDEELFARFDGGTVAPGQFAGFYRDPDTSQRVDDLSFKYTVAVPAGQLDELRSLLAVACFSFEQKCIYLSIAGQVEFIESAKHGNG